MCKNQITISLKCTHDTSILRFSLGIVLVNELVERLGVLSAEDENVRLSVEELGSRLGQVPTKE